jgi:hypothetical protein
MKKIIGIIPLLLSLLLACDVLNGVYNERWSDRVVPVFKTGSGTVTLTNPSIYTWVSGEDGHADSQWGESWSSPRFTDNGNTITDNNTGLMWTKNANHMLSFYSTFDTDGGVDGAVTWQLALDYIQALNNNTNSINTTGYTDWRLPNVREMESLINYGEADLNSWLGSQGFMNVQDGNYWTSTTRKDTPSTAFMVRMGTDYGFSYTALKIAPNFSFIWPVRGPDPESESTLLSTGQTIIYAAGDDGTYQKGVSLPSQRFYDNGDGTMTDRSTGLMWTKNANHIAAFNPAFDSDPLPDGDGKVTWQHALDYIQALNNSTNGVTNTTGYTDWRLPNVREMESLIHYEQDNIINWLGKQGFISVQNGLYHTSTTFAYDTSIYWRRNIGPSSRSDNQWGKTNTAWMWPVRGGKR